MNATKRKLRQQLIGCEVVGECGRNFTHWDIRIPNAIIICVPKDEVNVTGGFTRWDSIEKAASKIVIESINA